MAVRAAAGDAPNIEFRGHVRQDELVRLMQGARACLHAAEEDFGIALVEAQACGTPMIAFARGGARDIVRPPPASDPTGILFAQQTAQDIVEAMGLFDRHESSITPETCRRNAMRFTRERFRAAMLELVAHHMNTGVVAPGVSTQDAGRRGVSLDADTRAFRGESGAHRREATAQRADQA